MVMGRQYQQQGGLLVELNGFVDIELMCVSLLLAEAKVLEEEEDTGEEGVLEMVGVGEEGRRDIHGGRLERLDPFPLLPGRTDSQLTHVVATERCLAIFAL